MVIERRQGLLPGAPKRESKRFYPIPPDPKAMQAREVIRAFREGLIPTGDKASAVRTFNVEYVSRDDNKRHKLLRSE